MVPSDIGGMMLTKHSFVIILALTAAVLALLTGSVMSQSTPTKVQVDPNITKGKTPEPAVKPESTGGYDNFKDDNKNGVDDRYEKSEKGKVIVQPITEPAKADSVGNSEQPKADTTRTSPGGG
jgi:hypothetical protein